MPGLGLFIAWNQAQASAVLLSAALGANFWTRIAELMRGGHHVAHERGLSARGAATMGRQFAEPPPLRR